MNWVAIAEAFNERFEGRMLPDCDEPRPHRSKSSITTQRYRIETISKLTGLPLKGEKAKLKSLAEAAAGRESLKIERKPRGDTTGMGKDDSKTVESITSADATNASTTSDSNAAARSEPTPDEETDSSDDGGISQEENAQPTKKPRFHES